MEDKPYPTEEDNEFPEEDNEFPKELDIAFYKQQNPQLTGASDLDVRLHFANTGIKEGAWGSPCCARANLLSHINFEQDTLEIGPFHSPIAKGSKVKYFDVLDRDGLLKYADRCQITDQTLINNIPEIDFVSSTGDMSIIKEKFVNVVSSHSLEHQPDLVKHLKHVSRVLDEKGCYYFMIPDKRYCFDHYLPESTIADVLNAHLSEHVYHSSKSLIAARLLVTHNEAPRHWDGDHGKPFSPILDIYKVVSAINEVKNQDGTYIDSHAWQFTPAGFKDIILTLYNSGLIDLYPTRVYNTPKGCNEFCVILQKVPHPVS